jgi:uncharacterized protein (UPF0332 family)
VSDPAPDLAAQSWAIAVEFLLEAERASPNVMPRMAIHAAYYAMFHAARAALIKADGLAAPTRHGSVIGRFGQPAKQTDDAAMMATGKLLNEVQAERLLSDYRAGRRPPASDAVAAVAQARRFLETCPRYRGFPQPASDRRAP